MPQKHQHHGVCVLCLAMKKEPLFLKNEFAMPMDHHVHIVTTLMDEVSSQMFCVY